MSVEDHSALRQAIAEAALSLSANAIAPTLVANTLRDGGARLTAHGALSVETGAFTGRSPKDKFIVRDGLTEDKVWWDNSGSLTPAPEIREASFLRAARPRNRRDRLRPPPTYGTGESPTPPPGRRWPVAAMPSPHAFRTRTVPCEAQSQSPLVRGGGHPPSSSPSSPPPARTDRLPRPPRAARPTPAPSPPWLDLPRTPRLR